jgi:signal transduction histidine kinase
LVQRDRGEEPAACDGEREQVAIRVSHELRTPLDAISGAAQIGSIEERFFVTAITGDSTHLKNDA